MLDSVNTSDLPFLRDQVGVADKAATSIVSHRAGPDGRVGTGDDVNFATLAELDAVPWVGPAAFGKLVSYVRSHGVAGTELAGKCQRADMASVTETLARTTDPDRLGERGHWTRRRSSLGLMDG